MTDVRKPMLGLHAADGALGVPGWLVSICVQELERLATSVLHHAGIEEAT
jgi:hypothetical protein